MKYDKWVDPVPSQTDSEKLAAAYAALRWYVDYHEGKHPIVSLDEYLAKARDVLP